MARILVIDDDPAIVDLLRMRLEELGHQVFEALDAAGGLMIANYERPDIITLDFKMPGADGSEVLRKLRGNTFTARTKVLYLSGMSEEDLERAVARDPDTRFLRKPIDAAALRRKIAELLGEPAPAEPPPAAPPGEPFGGDILGLKLPPRG